MRFNVVNVTMGVIIASFTLVANASCSDWKYYGGTEIKYKAILLVFYDLNSIKITDKYIKVWIKSVSESDIDIFVSDDNRMKSTYNKSQYKVDSGYLTPYSKVTPEVTTSLDFYFVLFEEAANNSSLSVKNKMLYEIDCSENKMRVLNIMSFGNGEIVEINDMTEWSYISPDSNTETLGKILCGAKIT